jgi:hypothetical protein
MMTMGRYVVKPGGVIVAESDLLRWAEWYEKAAGVPFEEGGQRVARDKLPGGVEVSTVFLGTDHRFFGNGPPLLFETMIFGGPHDDFQARYATVEEARAGHAEAVELANGEQAKGN